MFVNQLMNSKRVSISIGFLITNAGLYVINCLPRKKIESLFAACHERFPGKFEHSTKKVHGTIPIS